MNLSKFIKIAILFAVLLVPGMASAGKNDYLLSETVEMVSINISEAYYADLEGDGLENDVFVGVDLYLSGRDAYNFDYYIFLTLPSGLQFSYAYAFSAKTDYIYFGNYFWQHALEPGWYDVEVFIVMRSGGLTVSSEALIFDPPGGTGGSDPISFSLIFG
ncbi:MAG: hypothetical protein INQ03_25150 [Candidatus Heimdallarchaeota archaeon]|nr:hypothetical protein [Candidatus Heimdallarchaeota archaeon]